MIAMHPRSGNVDEAKLRDRRAFFGERGYARLGSRRDGAEEATGPFIGRGGVNHDIDWYGGDEVGEAARIADVADHGDDFVLDEDLGFGRGTGETVDSVIARAEEGFGKREAKVASGAKNEGSRHVGASGWEDEMWAGTDWR